MQMMAMEEEEEREEREGKRKRREGEEGEGGRKRKERRRGMEGGKERDLANPPRERFEGLSGSEVEYYQSAIRSAIILFCQRSISFLTSYRENDVRKSENRQREKSRKPVSHN